MRVAVYAIAKDEAKHVQRWLDSTREADLHVLVDTGSADDTVTIARDLGIVVHEIVVDPWRFDVSRNAALALVPGDMDYCIPLDLDEVMLPGWHEALEREFAKGVTRPRYQYVFSWHHDGSPGIQFYASKIHARRGYIWRHPIHEIPDIQHGFTEVESYSEDIVMHHLPDGAKSRGSYLPLLQMAAAEEPYSHRMSYYLAREYSYRGLNAESAAEFQRYLSMPTATWKAERAHACRFLAKVDPARSEPWLTQSIAERPNREAYCERALIRHNEQRWDECLDDVRAGMALDNRDEYQSEGFAWGSMLPDIGSVAAWNLGFHDEARALVTEALRLDPGVARIAVNAKLMHDKLTSS